MPTKVPVWVSLSVMGWVVVLTAIVALLALYLPSHQVHREVASAEAFIVSQCATETCPKVIGKQRIPRVIYRTGKSAAAIKSGPGLKAWEFTQKHNPEYRQVFYDDQEADAYMRKALNGSVYTTYKALVPKAAKADLWRYCMIYENGGVYLDVKSGARELCKLLRPDDHMVVSTWGAPLHDHSLQRPSFDELQQWYLAAEPKHPALLKTIENLVANVDALKAEGYAWSKDRRVDTLRYTGPLQFSKSVQDVRFHNVRLVCGHGNGIMVYDVAGTHIPNRAYSGPGYFLQPDEDKAWGPTLVSK